MKIHVTVVDILTHVHIRRMDSTDFESQANYGLWVGICLPVEGISWDECTVFWREQQRMLGLVETRSHMTNACAFCSISGKLKNDDMLG